MNSERYYECHITVEPYPYEGELADVVRNGCELYDAKSANFMMVKDDSATPDAFITLRGVNFANIYARMYNFTKYLEAEGHVVKRAKLEDTLFDTKLGDILK